MSLKVLFLASEVAPFSKTGGLGDVSGALPAALARHGHTVDVVTPYYASVRGAGIRKLDAALSLKLPFGTQQVSLYEARLNERLRVLFVDHPPSFQRSGPYGDTSGDYPDNHRRFGLFSIAALATAETLKLTPDIVHCNDWQAGLGPLALKRGFAGATVGRARSLFTVHNLAYQGVFPKYVMTELGLPWDVFTQDGLEFYDQVNFIKAGLAFSDAITTVSPRYAREIQDHEAGQGLDGLLRARADRLTGILNGIDVEEWDPTRDAMIPARYSATSLEGKAQCRAALLNEMGLKPAGPVFGVVSRLVEQKGTDLLLEALPQLLDLPWRLVLLGTGAAAYENGLRDLAAEFPERIAVRIGYDRALSHLIEAGSDFFVMPSRFEPCGLNQMYSLRYGTVPIVRNTGGLADTVTDFETEGGNGIVFDEVRSAALIQAIRRAFALYQTPARLSKVCRIGMGQDHSWERSAKQYEALYEGLLR
ncbi:MAG: glycogen synthase GlgA [Myxococcaceae bacterium]